MKKLCAFLCLMCLTAALSVPASAAGPLEYSIDAPGDPDYGTPTSFEPVITADGGARRTRMSVKTPALIPPGFGTASADALNTGTPLTPNLAPGSMPATGTAVNGTSAPIFVPGSTIPTVNTPADPETSAPSTGYTEVTSDLYYSGGHLGTLEDSGHRPVRQSLEGTGSATLIRARDTSKTPAFGTGNVCIAGQQPGCQQPFGKIHTLELGDEITLTTMLGTRIYEVVSVSKVSETDRSGLAATTENMITLLHLCDEPERLPLVRQGSGPINTRHNNLAFLSYL